MKKAGDDQFSRLCSQMREVVLASVVQIASPPRPPATSRNP